MSNDAPPNERPCLFCGKPAVRRQTPGDVGYFDWDCSHCERRYELGLPSESSWHLRSAGDREALAALVDRENARKERARLS